MAEAGDAQAQAAEVHKQEGNAHFAKGEFLKAAAAYTKAIKAAPTNHVLYSNRAQAFLKLNKVSKALDDADTCLRLDPSFVKGYHRKASALHAMGEESKSREAADMLMGVIDTGMDDKDLVRLGVTIRGRAFAQQLDAKRKASAPAEPPTPEQTPATPTPAPAAKPAAATGAHAAVGAAEGAAPAVGGAAAAAGDESTPPWKAEPEEFAAGCLQPILKEFMEKGLSAMPSVCFLQPSPQPKGSVTEPQLGQINIKPAFTSPTNLAQCSDFLRKQAASSNARSAAIFVRKGSIEYPCVWKEKTKTQWSFGPKVDGVFMQCETPTERSIYFTELLEHKAGEHKAGATKTGATKVGVSRSIGETVQLDVAEFALFPKIFGEQ